MSIRRFLRRAQWDRERSEEMESYLRIETDENVARSLPYDEARAAALRKLGNSTLIREEIYRINTITVLDALVRDMRYSLRMLGRSPANKCCRGAAFSPNGRWLAIVADTKVDHEDAAFGLVLGGVQLRAGALFARSRPCQRMRRKGRQSRRRKPEPPRKVQAPSPGPGAVVPHRAKVRSRLPGAAGKVP